VTLRIYYTEPNCRTFNATVTTAFDYQGRPAVTLDRTAFYPTSGGQPFDTGRLGQATVVEVIDAPEIVHVLSAPLTAGTSITGEVDWQRRFDHMQQHTGQHLLSAAFDRLFDNRTVGFHMGDDVSTVDLSRDATSIDIERAVDEANNAVWNNVPVAIRFVSQEEAQKLPLRKEPTREGPLRVIDIAGVDLSACGGTHVERTGTVGLIAAVAWERLRGGTRVTFVCGARALRVLRMYRDSVAASVRVLSVLPAELPAAAERLQAEGKDLRKQLRSAQERLAAYEAVRLADGGADVDGVRLIVEVLEGWDAAGLKAIAAAVTAARRACVLLASSPPPAAVVIARSPGIAVDAQVVLRELVAQLGGRGGGKPELAQGGGVLATAAQIVSTGRSLLETAIHGSASRS
jgi:alanyl-tRNA synthetase